MGIRNTTRNIFKAAAAGLITTIVVAGLTGAIVNQRFAAIQLDQGKLKIDPRPTRIFDANGNMLAQFEKDQKEMTPYSEIPTSVVEAIVSTEDREFFNHAGINIRAIFRSTLVDFHSGSFAQGGSTITQQLVKRVYLNPGKTLDRKIQEAVYATAIEKEYSKQDILALYLDNIFYGERAYGIKNAVQTYFGMTLDQFEKQNKIDLIAKSALLAGIPNAPTLMDPYLNPKTAMVRRNTVLTNMYVEGYITKDEYEAAKAKGFEVLPKPNVPDNMKVHYPEMVSYVLSEASKDMNMPIEDVMYSGLTIYTSFEPQVYDAMRQHMADGSLYPTNPAGDSRKIEGAAVFLNPQNGEIYALTGSREQTTGFLTFNRAYQAKRQPGSAFKPLIDYGPALEKGIMSPYSSIPCGQTISGYHVKDDTPCGGSMSMAEALRVSENSPAVWTLNKVGISYARDYLSKLGIDLAPEDVYLPIAIGGIEYGVTPLQMADAYQVYANGGKRAQAHAIRRIVNNLNEVIYEPDTPKQTIKESTATQMDGMLRSVVTSGTGRNADIPGYNIEGKTGTNENPDGHGNKDIWFAGFTPNMVGVVWMGFDNTDASHYIPSGQTSYIAAKMFGEIAQDTLKILPQVKQDESSKVEKISLDLFRNTEGNQVTIKWEDKPGLKYEVYKGENVIGESLDGVYTDTDVEVGKSYTYKVVGYDDSTGDKVLESNDSTIQLPKVVEQPQSTPQTATPNQDGNMQNKMQTNAQPTDVTTNQQPSSNSTTAPTNTNTGTPTTGTSPSTTSPTPTNNTTPQSGTTSTTPSATTPATTTKSGN